MDVQKGTSPPAQYAFFAAMKRPSKSISGARRPGAPSSFQAKTQQLKELEKKLEGEEKKRKELEKDRLSPNGCLNRWARKVLRHGTPIFQIPQI